MMNPRGCPWHIATAVGAMSGLCFLLAFGSAFGPPVGCFLAAWVGWFLGSLGVPAQVGAVERAQREEHERLQARILALESVARFALWHPQSVEVHTALHDIVGESPETPCRDGGQRGGRRVDPDVPAQR